MMGLASVFNNNTEALYNVDSDDNNNVLSDKKNSDQANLSLLGS